MKQFKLQGFGNNTVLDNKSILDENGKKVKVVKGAVKLTATENAEGIEAGKEYTFNVDDLMAAGDGNWEDSPMTGSVDETPFDLGAGESSAPTEAQILAAKRKELKAVKANASAALLEATLKGEDVSALKSVYMEANSALEAFEAEHKPVKAEKVAKVKSPELVAAEEALIPLKAGIEAKVEELNAARQAYKAQIEVIKGLGGRVKGSGGNGANPNKGAHITYETAQEIRKAISEGAKAKETADKFGCSISAVNYIVKYLQHKLKRGDVAYTPLVNEYYPVLGGAGNITGTDGAPYKEDGIKEDTRKYKVATNR